VAVLPNKLVKNVLLVQLLTNFSGAYDDILPVALGKPFDVPKLNQLTTLETVEVVTFVITFPVLKEIGTEVVDGLPIENATPDALNVATLVENFGDPVTDLESAL
jgi:hypothetical protein